MNRSLIIAVVVLAAAVLGGAFWLFSASGSDRQVVGADGVVGGETTAPADTDATPTGDDSAGFQPTADKYPDLAAVTNPSNAQEFLEIHETDIVIGNANAPVTVHEFFSFNCPACKNFHEGSYQQVLANFVNRGLVKVVKREYLLNRGFIGIELLAGAGAQCFLDSEQHKTFSDLMFANQGRLDRNNPADALVPMFAAVGLDEVQARSCMADDRNRTLVFMRAVQAQAELGVNATPTLYINGQRFNGSPANYAQLSEALRNAAN